MKWQNNDEMKKQWRNGETSMILKMMLVYDNDWNGRSLGQNVKVWIIWIADK